MFPESNQGPLVGIFITGPMGFIIGIPIGYLPVIFKIFEKVKMKAYLVVTGTTYAILCFVYLSGQKQH